MIKHLSSTRGFADHGWLKSRHTFSFGDYFNPERMSFGTLRVINDDSVAPGMGFGTHPHRDMEIISIPLQGSLRHQDSEGNSTVIKKGEVQIMSAGTGIAHSEHNNSKTDEVKFLQIWVLPKRLGIKPAYGQKFFPPEDRRNKWNLVVSPDGSEGSLVINQDAFFSLGDLSSGTSLSYSLKLTGNGVYIMILSGEVSIDGENLNARDGVGLEKLKEFEIKCIKDAEILVMEIPMLMN